MINKKLNDKKVLLIIKTNFWSKTLIINIILHYIKVKIKFNNFI